MNAEQLSKVGSDLVRRCGTRDPFQIAKELGIIVLDDCENFGQLKGMYRVVKKNRFIFLNQDLSPQTKRVSYNLENGKWGSRFPTLMNELYQGTLDKDNVETAIVELKKIQLELQAFSPDKVVWDIDDLSKQPPWGKNISNDITNLSNYFVTSDGEDFITIFFNALEKAKKLQMDLTIESV